MQGLGKMIKGSIQRLDSGCVMAGVLLSILLLAVAVPAEQAESPNQNLNQSQGQIQGRSDLIVIDVLKTRGPLERPAVRFFHDRHTEALAKQKKDCLACHPLVEEGLAPAFGRTEEMTRQTIMETFHDRCIACHKENRDQGEPSGPVTCGSCHVEEPVENILWAPIDLDQALHYRHVKASDQKCEQCHHQYNEQTQKLVYVKGQEGACIYCHKEQAEEKRISIQAASHLACVGCHRQKAEAGQKAGPVQCAGCHDPRQQALHERPADVPRLQRNQPDVVMVKTAPLNQDASNQDMDVQNPGPDVRMGAVPFDHKVHEGYLGSCKTCHHADLQACAQCHTIQGDEAAEQVKLAQAMHQPDADMSCVGCHNQRKEQLECAGCHHSIPQARTLTSPAACQTCHLAPPSEEVVAMDKAQARAMATELLAARQPVRGTVGADQIPEIVTINALVQNYEAVQMPHRKIVLTLAQANQDSDLAAYFHSDPLTLCQGCHHNSPASLKPPQCGSCHGRTSEALNLKRPGLLAAYHQQCLECHQEMGIDKPAARDCTACHAKRQ